MTSTRNMTPKSKQTTTQSSARPTSLVRRLSGMLGLLGVSLLLGGCGDAAETPATPQAEVTDVTQLQQTAYRVRTDFAAPLNANSGWAAQSNTAAVVLADQPFRLRLEVEGSDNPTAHQFKLQFRRNGGSWEPLLAEDFPYPVKALELDFSGPSDSGQEETWNIVTGEASALSEHSEGDDGFLRINTQDQPLLALANYHTHWQANEFKAILRLPQDAITGVLFGYQDADNHYRFELAAEGDLSLIRRENGSDSVLQLEAANVKADQWIEAVVAWEGSEVTIEYEWDPYVQGLEFSWDLGETIPQSQTGLYLPANSSTDLQMLEIGGETQSPRVSIVSSSSFDYGDKTNDLLSVSELPFVAGAGISYADTTPSWEAAAEHGEWEFPIVVRYLSDQAAVNETGDTFEFRMVDSDGEPIATAHLPKVTLEVPQGHLGGTFVETPSRIGPWEANNGDLYFIMEPSETDNMMMMVKSVDGGDTWLEMDGAKRPETGDLEGIGSVYSDGSIHILHQTSDHVFYHRFNTSDHAQADNWEIRDERLASPLEPPVQVADIVQRSDGSLVGVYGDLHKILYRVRSPEGQWNEATVVDGKQDRDLSGPVLTLGRDDAVHLAYTGIDGTAWYRQILPNGNLTPRQQVADGLGTEVQDAGGILPLVYLPETNTVSIIYRLENGELWERRVESDGQLTEAVQATSSKVVRNAADSEQVGADAIAYGDDVHLLFIEESSGHLFHVWRDGDGNWSEPTLEVSGENVLWVRGALIKQNAEGAVYGYVYDGGSNGGSGMNRYAELPLSAQ